MSKWRVTLQVDASVTVEVDAETQEQAEDLAWDKVGRPSLCHRCSHEIDLGDVVRALEAEEISK